MLDNNNNNNNSNNPTCEGDPRYDAERYTPETDGFHIHWMSLGMSCTIAPAHMAAWSCPSGFPPEASNGARTMSLSCP